MILQFCDRRHTVCKFVQFLAKNSISQMKYSIFRMKTGQNTVFGFEARILYSFAQNLPHPCFCILFPPPGGGKTQTFQTSTLILSFDVKCLYFRLVDPLYPNRSFPTKNQNFRKQKLNIFRVLYKECSTWRVLDEISE